MFLIKDIEIEKIQPINEHGLKSSVRGGLIHISFSSLPLIVLLMIFPKHINNQKKSKKAFINGAIIGGIIIIIITTVNILVLGENLASRNTFPIYALSKKISIANFLERIEALTATVWLISTFFKILLFYYGAIVGLAQIFNLKDYRPLTMPMANILIILSSVIYPNVVYASNWDTTVWIPFISTFSLILPFFILIINKFKNKRNK